MIVFLILIFKIFQRFYYINNLVFLLYSDYLVCQIFGAGWTGFEPVICSVTGSRGLQTPLPALILFLVAQGGIEPPFERYECSVLTIELQSR